MKDSGSADGICVPCPTPDDTAQFQEMGYVDFPQAAVLSPSLVKECITHLDDVIHGQYDRGTPPTKAPEYTLDLLDAADKRRRRTVQIINIRHCDTVFSRLVHSRRIGELVGRLTGWEGCRVAQDQVWFKPPGAAALSYHRDSPYFNFVPNDIVTVWITFDDLTGADAAQLGPLEYYPESHRWGEGRIGLAKQFFDADYYSMLRSAAQRAGEPLDLARVHCVAVPAGGLSVHHGSLWHGSGPNRDRARSRRGIGIHFCREAVLFRPGRLAPMWEAVRAKYNDSDDTATVPLAECPVTWSCLT